MTTPTITNKQLEAWAGLGPWSYRSQEHDDWGIVRTGRYIVCRARDCRFMDDGYLQRCREEERDPHEIPARLIAAAPDLARLVLEKDKEIARLKGLAWIAYHEFNAINARSGGPLDQYGMVTVTHEYWQAITDLFAKAAGETTPWPTENAKAIFEEINRQAMKETSDE